MNRILCHVMLCHITLCYIMLCYVVVHYIIPGYVRFSQNALDYMGLYEIMLDTVREGEMILYDIFGYANCTV